MSLFICEKCGCVDNTNCNTHSSFKGELNPDFPNLHRMEMDGFDDEYEKTGIRSPKRLLCSECNMGKWHGEFAKKKATEAEIIMGEQLQGDEHNVFTFHPLWNTYDNDPDNFNLEVLRDMGAGMPNDLSHTRYIIKNTLDEPWDWMCASHDPYVREEPKTGRNDNCPCGSGKKHKKCCLRRGE